MYVPFLLLMLLLVVRTLGNDSEHKVQFSNDYITQPLNLCMMGSLGRLIDVYASNILSFSELEKKYRVRCNSD